MNPENPENPVDPVVGDHINSLLATSPLPPLVGDAGVAEKLVLLVHRGVDWDIWGGRRRVRYWDAFTDRVRAATYAGATLSHWWQDLSTQIGSTPRNREDRAAVALLLTHPAQRETLTVLRDHAPTLVLRIRVLAEARSNREGNTP